MHTLKVSEYLIGIHIPNGLMTKQNNTTTKLMDTITLRNNVLKEDEVKLLMDQLWNGEITFSRFVEILNEKVNQFTITTTNQIT